MKTNFHLSIAFLGRQNKVPRQNAPGPRIHPPEEHSHSGPAGSSVGSASSHIFSIQLAETAGALRAQDGAAKQAQGRMLPVVVRRFGTSEDR